jgi:hypothetical protein
MDITQVYAIIVFGIALCFLLRNILSSQRFMTDISLQTSKRLTYSYILNRHALIGPWSVATAMIQVVYLTVNVFCLCFDVDDLPHAGRRAGTLSLINLGPLLGVFHLDFLATLLGLPLKTVKRVHRLASLAAFALAVFHVVIVAATEKSAFQTKSSHPFVIIVRSSSFHILFTLTS